MLRLLVLAATAVVLLGTASAGIFDSGTMQNKFIVTYSAFPDPLHAFSFYTMPRTLAEAEEDDFTLAATRDQDYTKVYCRKQDYRVCVLFDSQGSVAGIQISVAQSELDSVNAPGLDVEKIPEIFKQTLLGEEVYSTIAFFVDLDVLVNGGRGLLEASTLTAPNGIYLLQTDDDGTETGRLHVTTEQSDAEGVGFTKQACFHGMGLHYFQDLRKDGTCAAHRPYFLLYGPKTAKLNGFGFTMYGKVSQGRGWFETPPALVAKKIAPNSPSCMSKWIKKYGLFTMHVFFVEKPWNTGC